MIIIYIAFVFVLIAFKMNQTFIDWLNEKFGSTFDNFTWFYVGFFISLILKIVTGI